MLSISEVSRQTGLPIHTLRYYDECGLLPRVQRDDNGYRRFDDDDLEWIGILKCLKATEMPLAEMQAFTELVQEDIHTASDRLALLRAHRQQFEARLAEIHVALEVIDGKIAYYSDLDNTSTS